MHKTNVHFNEPLNSDITHTHGKKYNRPDMDGPRVCHTEWSKSEKEKLMSYIYTWNLEKMVPMNLFARQE